MIGAASLGAELPRLSGGCASTSTPRGPTSFAQSRAGEHALVVLKQDFVPPARRRYVVFNHPFEAIPRPTRLEEDHSHALLAPYLYEADTDWVMRCSAQRGL